MRRRCKIFFILAELKFGNSAKGRTVHCCLMVGSFDCVSTESGEVQRLGFSNTHDEKSAESKW